MPPVCVQRIDKLYGLDDHSSITSPILGVSENRGSCHAPHRDPRADPPPRRADRPALGLGRPPPRAGPVTAVTDVALLLAGLVGYLAVLLGAYALCALVDRHVPFLEDEADDDPR